MALYYLRYKPHKCLQSLWNWSMAVVYHTAINDTKPRTRVIFISTYHIVPVLGTQLNCYLKFHNRIKLTSLQNGD
jgi:hypothetical protein